MEKSHAELYKEACNLEKNLETRKQTHHTGEIEILETETGKLTVPKNKTKNNCFNCGVAGNWAQSCTEQKKNKRTCHYCYTVGHIQCATGSKILTKPEPDRIGIILAGTRPDYKPEKVNRISRIDRIGRIFTGFFKL